jgi:hypothetical protein
METMENRRGAMHSRMDSPDKMNGLPTRLHTAPQINIGGGYPTVSIATAATDDPVMHRL